MGGIVENLLLYYIQILAIMNPFAVLPTFISLTRRATDEKIRVVVNKVLWAGLILVTIFTLIGNYILVAFNISIPALRIGGGIILVAISLDMLSGFPRTKKVRSDEFAVVPITTPLLIGPGTLTTILLLTSRNPSISNTLIILLAGYLAVLTSYFVLKYAKTATRYIPFSTIRVIGRIMSLIIISIAVEMMIHGVVAYYNQYFK
ncbi:MAG: MarC family protein [Desulfurococcaceae archaeon]